jgi:hypothetical protein
VVALILKFAPGFRFRLMPTRKVSTFSAVKGVSYAIDKNSLFVLLGHNGMLMCFMFYFLLFFMTLLTKNVTFCVCVPPSFSGAGKSTT